MTAVPARVAGVPEVVLCVPPDRATGVASRRHAGRRRRRRRRRGVPQSAVPRRSPRWPTAPSPIRPVDVIVGPGNVYVALAKREVAGGLVGVPSAFAGPTEVVVVADGDSPADLAADRRHRAGRARPRRAGLAHHLGRGGADAVERRDRAAASPRSPRRAGHRGHPRPAGGYAVLVDGPEQAMAVANAIAPEHLELMCADPEALVPLVRHAGAVFCGPWSPAALGDYVAGPSPRAADVRLGPLRAGAHGRRLHASTSTSSPPTQTALRAVAPHVVTLAEAEGLPPTPRPSAARSAPVTAACPSATTSRARGLPLAAGRRVACGSTPTSRPSRRRPRWRDALAAELSRVDWHRYPDRAATELRAAIAALHGVTAEPGLRRQRLQRGAPDAAAHLRRPRPHGRDVRADVRAARPHRPHHRHRRRRGRAARRLHASTSPRCAGSLARAAAGGDLPLLAEQPDRAWSSREAVVREVARRWRPGLLVVDEAYGQFAPWSALELVDDDRPLVVTRTYSKTWSMAAARLGYLVGPTWLVAELDKVVLPYHLDAAKQVGRAPRAALRRRDGGTASAVVEERERRSRRRWPSCPVDVWPSGANFVLFRPRRARRPRRVAGPARPRRAGARLLVVAAPRRAACGSPSARPPRTTPSSPRSREVLA